MANTTNKPSKGRRTVEKRRGDYKSDRPTPRDLPGTGQSGDEINPLPEIKEIQELTEPVLEKGLAGPAQPSSPAHERTEPETPAERAAWRAEEELDHAGLEEEEEQL